MMQTNKFRALFEAKRSKKPDANFIKKISTFQSENDLLIPDDLAIFLQILESVSDKMDDNLYQFYSIDQFRSVEKELSNWQGLPNYKNIVNTLIGSNTCFVIADYMFHMFSYAIRLNRSALGKNEIYIICGEEYKLIANSFTDFLHLYFEDSIELQFS